MTWRDRAACIGYDFAFERAEVDRGAPRREAIAFAKTLCEQCPVRQLCLDAAIATEGPSHNSRWSIQGGMTPAERAKEFDRRVGVRKCEVCGKPLPEDMQATAKYHRGECKATVRRERERRNADRIRQRHTETQRRRREREQVAAGGWAEVRRAKAKSEAARAVVGGGAIRGRRVS